VIHLERAVEVEPDRLDQRLGLQGLAAGLHLLDGRPVGHVERPLGDDRPLIEISRHVVGRDAGDADALLAGLAVGRRAGKRREQRGVDVDDAVLVAKDHLGAEDAHVPRQHHQVDPALVEDVEQPLLVGAPPGVADVVERDVGCSGDGRQVVVVADHDVEFGVEASLLLGLDQCLQAV